MVEHVCPCWTKWNLLQLPTMPDWVGTGVETPLPGVVVVVVVVVEVLVVGVGGVVVGGIVMGLLEEVLLLLLVLELELEVVGPGS